MTRRERLQYCYELAFYPPRLNELWQRLKRDDMVTADPIGELLDTAWLLHQSLPSDGYSSQRALSRLALYQARSRAFGMPRFIQNIRRRMHRPPLSQTEVPGHLVRDIALPKFSHG